MDHISEIIHQRGRPLITWGAWCKTKKKLHTRKANYPPSHVFQSSTFWEALPRKKFLYRRGSREKINSFRKFPPPPPPQIINGRPLTTCSEHCTHPCAVSNTVRSLIQTYTLPYKSWILPIFLLQIVHHRHTHIIPETKIFVFHPLWLEPTHVQLLHILAQMVSVCNNFGKK